MKGSFLATVLMVSAVALAQPAKPPAGPSAEEIAKMTAAAPAAARVKPQQPRKLLVFSIAWGYKHTAIPYGKKLAEILAQKTGAFAPVISDDLAMFEADSLRQFDAIWFNNTNNEIFLPDNFEKLPADQQAAAKEKDQRLKKNLVEFLESGKGLFVHHAGVASFRKWDQYGDIVGARFQSHPWNSGSTVTLKVDDPGHTCCGAFPEKNFVVKDEIYQVTDPYSRQKLRVLVSVDTSKTDMNKKGIVRKDNDFAMTWVKNFGKGRVFYCALGHDHDIYWNTTVVQHYLDGIQFALGDLKGETLPEGMASK